MYKFCWDKCQQISERVCEHRLKIGKCKVLDKPKDPPADIRGFFGKEKGEVQVTCEAVK